MALAIKRAIANAEAASYYKGDMEGVFTDAKLKKAYKIEVNWELIKAQTGEQKISGNSDAKNEPAPVVLAYLLGEGNRFTYFFKDVLSRLLKDDMGKEAFEETFDKVMVNMKVGPKHACTLTKEGKTLNFNVDVQLDDFQNCDRALSASDFAKQLESML